MKLTLAILFFLTLSLHAQNGIVRSYYANHKIRARLSYVNDVLDAKSVWYYDNGNMKTIKTFTLGKLNGKVSEFYESGLAKEEYFVNKGIRDGFDRIYWENGALKELRSYEMGQLVKRISFDYDSLFVPNLSDYKGIISNKNKHIRKDILICNVDICPSPIGGKKVIQDRVIYPKAAKLYGLEGVVSIIATIDVEGFVTRTNVIKSLGLGCDEAAVDAVKKTRFLPGHDKGKIVESQLTINIEFKIKKDSLAANTISRYNEKNIEREDNEKIISPTKIEDDIDDIITQTESSDKKSGIKEATDTSVKQTDDRQTANTTLTKSEQTGNPNIAITGKPKTKICNVEVCPEPIGGLAELIKRFKIPTIAYGLKLNGEIVVDVNIDRRGNVINTKVVSGIGFGVGTAAEVAILNTKFTAGLQNGEPTDATIRITLPVKTTK